MTEKSTTLPYWSTTSRLTTSTMAMAVMAMVMDTVMVMATETMVMVTAMVTVMVTTVTMNLRRSHGLNDSDLRKKVRNLVDKQPLVM